ncbi:hypothetical protein TRAPUB_9845 [Trametes pubescens]|uniref:BTB domain-containing protein n=1 Tax=Trametes pubescens TaxID=154538 RepID=A0A1M2W170_TRAPU|nr:hypothetical protein TRAPUB_9845 [Trametes pubescens]
MMTSTPRAATISYRMRPDNRFLVDPSAPQMRRERESAWVSRSYPPSAPTSPIMTSPPSPVLHPEHPPRSQTPDNWNLSSPNASEMPSPMRRALMPMLSLARETKEETYGDRSTPREPRAEDVPPSRRSASKPRSSPASPPQSRASQQSYRKYRSPRVESESDPEEGGMSRSWRSTPGDRSPPRTPPPLPNSALPSGARTSPRRQKSKVKRSSVAHRRLMESAAFSSDSGIAGSPLCQSPLVSLPLPDTLPSASEFERTFFPPERPTRSQQRASPIPSPSSSPLALQPVSPCAEKSALQLQQGAPQEDNQQHQHQHQSSPRHEDEHAHQRSSSEEQYRPRTPERSSRRSDSFNGGSVPVPLSPGSTLAQTRPASPLSEGRSSSPKVPYKPHQQATGPIEEPAVRHSQFYMEDEMVILRVENCLFRVHRYFVERDSTFFRDFFQRTLSGTGMGKTDDMAIKLPDVSRREFECLLHFLYHGASNSQNDSILNLVLLLSTSSALTFPAARTHAITALDQASPPLDPVERVFLAEKYNIPAWLRPAYVELCSRAHPLEDSEAEVLGLQTTARLARAREAVLEEKVQEWRRAVERMQKGEGQITKEDMEVREAKVVERVVDDIFATER